jgi:hypothetical protein
MSISRVNPIVEQIPLLSRAGEIRGYAQVDEGDAAFVNQWVWRLSAKGYAARTVRIDGVLRTFWLQRELLGLTPGDGLEGDHINRNRLDYRRQNLRAIPKKGNRQNLASRGVSSTYRGVDWSKTSQRWRARIKVDGKEICLGHFLLEVDAALAARSARLRLMPYAVD